MKEGGAAKGELVLAMYELANSFRHGWGVEKDPVAARSYYETAANLGDTDAMNEVARCYEEGFGGKKDKVSGSRLFWQLFFFFFCSSSFYLIHSKGAGEGEGGRGGLVSLLKFFLTRIGEKFFGAMREGIAKEGFPNTRASRDFSLISISLFFSFFFQGERKIGLRLWHFPYLSSLFIHLFYEAKSCTSVGLLGSNAFSPYPR